MNNSVYMINTGLIFNNQVILGLLIQYITHNSVSSGGRWEVILPGRGRGYACA